MPASFSVLRSPPQSPVSVCCSKSPSSAAAFLPGNTKHGGTEQHQRGEATSHELDSLLGNQPPAGKFINAGYLPWSARCWSAAIE